MCLRMEHMVFKKGQIKRDFCKILKQSDRHKHLYLCLSVEDKFNYYSD